MTFYVTTPIFYVNAAPHLGHAYTTIGADILARHMRQRGEEVFFLTGTDEHGEPVALAAEREGVTPQELADRNAERFKAMMGALGASNDFFIRTSDVQHVAKVQEILTRVKDNGYVYKGLYEGWYCPRCADFKTDSEIGPENTCPIHEIALVFEKEENYFFALSKFQEPLEALYAREGPREAERGAALAAGAAPDGEGHAESVGLQSVGLPPDFVLPAHHFNEARAFVAQGLQDVSLTRAKLTWGVPVPWDEGHVFYVWFDALLNYVTALSYARPGEDLTDKFWPASFHIIGKDILKFHTVFWPALLMAAGLELPEHVFVHGFLLMDDKKMSKSLGNVLDPFAIIERYGADALRYYCFREVSFGRDGSVSAAGFEARYEGELANEYGNLASRTLAMVARYRDGELPAATLAGESAVDAPAATRAGESAVDTSAATRAGESAFDAPVALDPDLTDDFAGLAEEVCALLDRAEITQALEAIWRRVRRLNRYVEERAPWVLAKDLARARELDAVLASLAEGLRVVSVLLVPYLPVSAERVLEVLGAEDRDLAVARFGAGGGAGGAAGRPRRVEAIEPLFPKL
ncbi:MAG TPA: class I tRNA ligase family protein [Solirubrobacteraceae bacterium]|jgi:methionyl-tRNA synthetase|nr:class I tRNA ligase family protein [Solirubrobacteraceae bacterium]